MSVARGERGGRDARPTESPRGRGSRFRITPPEDYILARDVCSYGYFRLAPNVWDRERKVLRRPLMLDDGPAVFEIAQPGTVWRGTARGAGAGAPLEVRVDRAISSRERGEATRMISRMLRLDESAETIAAFHRVDPRWKRTGHGRVFRSPTLFEDIIKTVTSCNVQWASTIIMNRRLCEVLGGTPAQRRTAGREGGASGIPFPTASQLARARVSTLRARCRVGYRDQRMKDLAGMCVARGRRAAEIDEAWFEDPATPDDAIHERLLTLPGIGPYAAANVMQTLGRYARLPMDSETLKHGRTVLGFAGTDRQVLKRVAAHFAPFGEHTFRSYWFEMWLRYEEKHGPAHAWAERT